MPDAIRRRSQGVKGSAIKGTPESHQGIKLPKRRGVSTNIHKEGDDMNQNWKKLGVLCVVVMLGVVLVSGCTSKPVWIGDVKITLKALSFGGNVTIKMDDVTIFDIVITKGQTRELLQRNVTNGTHTYDVYYGDALQERKRVKVTAEKTTNVEFILYKV